MNRHSDVLESRRFQTYQLPPDKCMHLLTAQQTGHGPAQVLYKKQGGVAGRLGGGSFGSVQLEHIDSECEGQPSVRAVKTIGKAVANDSKIHWEQEIENLLDLSKVGPTLLKVESDENLAHDRRSFRSSSFQCSAGGKTKDSSTSPWNISKLATYPGAETLFVAKATSAISRDSSLKDCSICTVSTSSTAT